MLQKAQSWTYPEGQFTPFLYGVETSFRDDLWTPELTGRSSRSQDQWSSWFMRLKLHNTPRVCHMVPSINKASARADETIWPWTTEENIPHFVIILTHTNFSALHWNLHMWSAATDSSATQWCEIKRVRCPLCERSTVSLGTREPRLCKQDRPKDKSPRTTFIILDDQAIHKLNIWRPWRRKERHKREK